MIIIYTKEMWCAGEGGWSKMRYSVVSTSHFYDYLYGSFCNSILLKEV